MCHHSHNINGNREKEREFVLNIIWYDAPSVSLWYALQSRRKYKDIILTDNSRTVSRDSRQHSFRRCSNLPLVEAHTF